MNIQTTKQVIQAAVLADDAVIMEGVHGIGKSEIVKQFAQENGYHLEELFLSHQEVGDLIGIPHMIESEGTQITTWSVPIWLQRIYKAAAQNKPTILFLDELNRAPIDVRQSALQLVLERQIHEHVLPEVNGQRTMIVAAINPTDQYQVDELDGALMDRFLHVKVEPDVQAWLAWASSKGINAIVRNFISEHPNRMWWQPADGGIGATPRSWTKLAKLMDFADTIAPEIVYEVMKGKIGEEIGSQFYQYYKNYSSVITIKDIEKIVNDNSEKVQNVEELAEIIAEFIKDAEVIQKSELATQLKDKYNKKKDKLPFAAYLYALEIEISAGFLKAFRKDEPEAFKEFVAFDTELNNKRLFTRLVEASDRS